MNHHFTLEILPGEIARLVFETEGQKVNTFCAAALAELEARLEDLGARQGLRGLIFASGKPGQFIAGADLHELAALSAGPVEALRRGTARGHRLFAALEALPFPTVGLIDGACMGGGTELVLALDYRVAANSPKVRIGLPEVKVGLIPGWGGTQRLPRVVGMEAAIEMITTGEPVDAKRATAIGLVHDALDGGALLEEGVWLIEEALRTGAWRGLRQRKAQPFGLSEDQERFIFAVAEAAVAGRAKGHYPAPSAALRAVRQGINLPLADGLAGELEIFCEVAQTPVARNLIANFFNSTRLQRGSGVDNPSVTPRAVSRVGVLGAGLMGAGIATAFARRGVAAEMVDVDDPRVADGLRRARKVVEDRMAIGRATAADLAGLLTHLHGGTSRRVFEDCGVIVEAVTEDEALKTRIIAEMADVARPDGIFATNTSTISITRLAGAWPHPERFAGMHFFSPVDRMQLVEVVRGERTDDETTATLAALARRIGKTPVIVRDCPGFLVNRVLMPYMAEALVLLGEGVPMERVDRVAVKWGMPVGPLTLYDMVGLDTGLYAGAVLQAGYPDRAVKTPVLEALVEMKHLGQKTGRGFYTWDAKGKPTPDAEAQAAISRLITAPQELTDVEIADRLFLSMALEAVRAQQDGITRHPGDAEMAMQLGCGFPAFRGGPLRWCDTEGAASIVERAARWALLGARYHAPKLLIEAARTGAPLSEPSKLASVSQP